MITVVNSGQEVSLLDYGKLLHSPTGRVIGFRVGGNIPAPETAASFLIRLVEAQQSIQWVAGDLYNHPDVHTEDLHQYLDAKYQTIINYAYVARRITPDNRRDNLMYTHHQIAANANGRRVRMPDGEIKLMITELLDAAEKHLLTVANLKKLYRRYDENEPVEKTADGHKIYEWINPLEEKVDDSITINLEYDDIAGKDAAQFATVLQRMYENALKAVEDETDIHGTTIAVKLIVKVTPKESMK